MIVVAVFITVSMQARYEKGAEVHTISALQRKHSACEGCRKQHSLRAGIGTLIGDQPVSVQECTQIRLITNYIGLPMVCMNATIFA